MKNFKYYTIFLAAALIGGCAQEINELTPPVVTPEIPTGSRGNLNFTKFVTIGNSLVAGFRSNALYTEGQNQSIGKIISKQVSFTGSPVVFNQPDINSVNGFSGFIPSTTIPLGRLVLFDPDGSGPRSASPSASATPAREVTCPSAVSTPAMPAPYNTAANPTTPEWAYGGVKTQLNNFGVPGITVGELLVPTSANPSHSLYYTSRFATNPGVSTILGDALATGPTFILVEIGNNDILGYATGGASNPAILTTTADFTTRMNAVIGSILGSSTASGVVANIPNVTSIPYFFTVPWNAIPLDATSAASVTTNLATPYNGFLQNLVTAGVITADEAQRRTLSFTAKPNNAILISDETLTDLTPFMTGPAAGLLPYARARQTTANDLITLPAGGVLGTCVGGSAQSLNGITVPLGDNFVLIPSETQEILTRTAAFNATIAAAVAGSNNRLALADVNSAFTSFVTTKGAVVDGVLLTPSITPPYGGFSEDGVHPNGRGYAFLANIFIDAINAKFSTTIPKAKTTDYSGNRTPITTTNSY